MLFAALFAVLFLKRHLNKWHFLGVALCMVRPERYDICVLSFVPKHGCSWLLLKIHTKLVERTVSEDSFASMPSFACRGRMTLLACFAC
jgi:hypothetical protein